MFGSTIFTIEVTKSEARIISDLVDILEHCPIDLGNDEYADILRAIANDWDSPETTEGILIDYVED